MASHNSLEREQSPMRGYGQDNPPPEASRDLGGEHQSEKSELQDTLASILCTMDALVAAQLRLEARVRQVISAKRTTGDSSKKKRKWQSSSSKG